jgi:hypothetical protein
MVTTDYHPHEIAYDALIARRMCAEADVYAEAHSTECCEPMALSEAVELVTADQRESWPELTTSEAIAHARNVVTLTDVATHTDWSHAESTRLGVAYLTVLATLETLS